VKIIILLVCLVAFSSIASVLQGIDRISTIYPEVNNKRIALLTHAAARNEQGDHLIDITFEQLDSLKVIFAPEHGVRSRDDDYVDDDVDTNTGVPIISLYKAGQRQPSDEDLKLYDVLIVDLKDVGVRFYTYATTAYLTIKKSIEAGKKVYILDRVNPLSGIVSGPVLDESLAGHMISYFSVPMSHGLTLGEYMKYVLSEHPNKKLLNIVRVDGWRREQFWGETNLNWISPSPALPTYEQAYLYSIFGSFESLNISVGRGKDNHKAFKYFGAPWITEQEAVEVTGLLNRLGLDGLLFTPTQWKVTRRLYDGEIARGFKVELVSYPDVNRFEALYRTLQVFYQYFKHKAVFNHWAKRYLGSELYLNLLKSNTQYVLIKPQVSKDERAFEGLSKRFHLY
jgi:uncharacterized protein YbbC (DUF1343 family)